MRFFCKICGKKTIKDIVCHGHTVSYDGNQYICNECNKPVKQEEFENSIPRCCGIDMTPI